MILKESEQEVVNQHASECSHGWQHTYAHKPTVSVDAAAGDFARIDFGQKLATNSN